MLSGFKLTEVCLQVMTCYYAALRRHCKHVVHNECLQVMACHYAKLKGYHKPTVHIRESVKTSTLRLDPLTESITSSDSEVEVEGDNIIEARSVMIQKLKTQQEWPEWADPDLFPTPERFVHTARRPYTLMKLVKLESKFKQKMKENILAWLLHLWDGRTEGMI